MHKKISHKLRTKRPYQGKNFFPKKFRSNTKGSFGGKFIDPENSGDEKLQSHFSGPSFNGMHESNKELLDEISELRSKNSELQENVDLLTSKADDKETLYYNEGLRMDSKVETMEEKLEAQEILNLKQETQLAAQA